MYIICLFDIAAIMCGMAKVAGLVRETDKTIPGATWVFVSTAIGSLVSPLMGCTPCIVFGEGFAGVLVGGKTGLTPIVMAFLFLCTLPFTPIFVAVPLFATAPVLVIIGVSLLGMLRHLEWEDMSKALPSFCTIVLMPYLYSIDLAIMAGLFAHISLEIMSLILSPVEEGKRCWKSLKSVFFSEVHLETRQSIYDPFYQLKLLHSTLKEKSSNLEVEYKCLFDSYSHEHGYLGAEEISKMAEDNGHPMTPEQLDAALAMMDQDGDGSITFDEFRSWCLYPSTPMHSGQSRI